MNHSAPVRVRFAPSPTGYLHVGGLRTALYNYLFARKNHGTFVLRIEDTDRARIVEGAVENLIDTLHWAGLEYDEGPRKGGPFAPYVQSERLSLYRDHVNQLLDNGHAYRCFCTSERLDEMRKGQEKNGLPSKYDRRCLNLSRSEAEEKLASKIPFVIRMKVPDSTTISFHDLIRETVEFSSSLVDDQVLLKSDGYPTYHLANVVDDHAMQISHVIRGEEWLSSTPKHVLLYNFFGWQIPTFAHLPLLLNPDRSKLSKRQGDVAVEDYRAKGYLKEAMINFIAMLGWNPGTEQELFSLEELIEQFSLDRVNKSGAIFNLEKLNWLNFEHLRKKSSQEMIPLLRDELSRSGIPDADFKDDYLIKVIDAMRERVSFVHDYIEQGRYFFEPPKVFDPEVVKKRWKAETPNELKMLVDQFSKLSGSAKEDFEGALHRTAQTLNIGNGLLIHAVRLAVSGVGGGPGVFEILSILGRDESIKRMKYAAEHIDI